MADVMTPVEVEDNRRRAINLLEAAKLICATINEEGYYFADEPQGLCDMALDELNGQSLSEIDRRYAELVSEKNQAECDYYHEHRRRTARDEGMRP